MKKSKLTLLLLVFAFLSGCSISIGNPTTNSTTPGATTSSTTAISSSTSNNPQTTPTEIVTPSTTTSVAVPTTPIENLTPEDLTYLDLFDINNIITIEINMSSSELNKIQEDYIKYDQLGGKSPIYRKADNVKITINKQGKDFVFEYDEVGVRMKGNTSRHKFIDENFNLYSNIHLKLSFEETFDDTLYYNSNEIKKWDSSVAKAEREERKFLGLSKLDLRYNKLRDQSFTKEHYALEMYRAFGIMTQHTNLGKVIINQDNNKRVNYGTYIITEALTKTFIKRSLENPHELINMGTWDEEKNGKVGVEGSKYGQLYKASYGRGSGAGTPSMARLTDNMLGVENENGIDCPAFEIKTNKDNGGDHTLIKKAFSTMQNQTESKIAEVVDLEYFAMYEAVSTFLGCPDDLRNNYNNYALYFRRTDGKMIIIPIDLDRCLGASREWDPTENAVAEISPFSNKAVGNGGDQVNPLYKRTILNTSTSTRGLYIEALNKILNSEWSSLDKFNSIHNTFKKHYEEFEKTTISNVPFSLNEKYKGTQENMSFKEYLSRKENTINKALGNEYTPDPGNPLPTTTTTPVTVTIPNTSVTGENLIKDCTEFYFRYTQNWETCDERNLFYKFDNTIYRFDHKIENKDINNLRFKVFAAELGSSGYWLRADYNGGMLVRHGDDILINPNSKMIGKTFSVYVNTEIGNVYWEIK